MNPLWGVGQTAQPKKKSGHMDDKKYIRLRYNRNTGDFERTWVRYVDNTFEPVRRWESISKKSRSQDPSKDWWLEDKPSDWDPARYGYNVALNHIPQEPKNMGNRYNRVRNFASTK